MVVQGILGICTCLARPGCCQRSGGGKLQACSSVGPVATRSSMAFSQKRLGRFMLERKSSQSRMRSVAFKSSHTWGAGEV